MKILTKFQIVVIIALALTGIFGYSYKAGINKCRAEIEQARLAEQKRIEAIETVHQEQLTKIHEQSKTTNKEVIRYVKENSANPVCIDKRGLSILQRARVYPGGAKN